MYKMIARNLVFLTLNCQRRNIIFQIFNDCITKMNKKLNEVQIRECSTRNLLNSTEDKFKENLGIYLSPNFKVKYFPFLKYTVPKLQLLLNISPNEAKEIVKTFPKFKKINSETLQYNYNLCIGNKIQNEMLLQYPNVLVIDNLYEKFQCLQKLDVDLNLMTPLLFANVTTLQTIVQSCNIERNNVPYKNRIIYMSKILNVPVPKVCEKIINHIYIFRIPLSRLENILEVLLKYGIKPDNILNDCWALRYSPEMIEYRLKRAIDSNVVKTKTWMIRCTDKVFEKCISRKMENKNILGDNSSVEEYLSKRLECDLQSARFLTEKYQAIGKMKILKMKEILDFLYEQGYTPNHVLRVPRILIHSLETTKLRIKQLKDIGYVTPSLAILCKSKRDFDKTLKIYAKKKLTNEEISQEE